MAFSGEPAVILHPRQQVTYHVTFIVLLDKNAQQFCCKSLAVIFGQYKWILEYILFFFPYFGIQSIEQTLSSCNIFFITWKYNVVRETVSPSLITFIQCLSSQFTLLKLSESQLSWVPFVFSAPPIRWFAYRIQQISHSCLPLTAPILTTWAWQFQTNSPGSWQCVRRTAQVYSFSHWKSAIRGSFLPLPSGKMQIGLILPCCL